MTGYAVTFNKRYKRAGHLFQNRYKSIICEEDPYLLELIRYIHLNPLRAKLVQDLNELDTYPWAGHSAILGHCKNPLLPGVRDQESGVSKQAASPIRPKGLVCSDSDLPRSIHVSDSAALFNRGPSSRIRTNQPKTTSFASLAPSRFKDKSLAEKTIEDVLLHFGETQTVARRRYREFVEKGIAQGRRPEFQGGGLVRSAGGKKAGLLGRSKEEREKGDARILGSGDFVSNILKEANDSMDSKAQRHVSLDDLVSRVCSRFRITPDELASKRRKREISQARAALCYLAVDELDYSGEELARLLSISGRGVSDCRDRGRTIIDHPEIIREYLS